MFPRGPRFEPLKVPDVPAPNAYNLPTDSQLDSYKRGAFLEKTDRFSKEKESEIPGPGTYATDVKKPKSHTTKPSHSSNLADRYAILQRKVEDLERVHNEGKKSHQIEVERLKQELSRSQKINLDQSERLDKQKKHTDVLEARIQELKKSASSDQSEIKDLRVKLRMSEHERSQIASRQGDAAELKKSLHALESKRRDELRERDRRISELEKAAIMDKKKKDTAEASLQALTTTVGDQLKAAQDAVQSVENQATQAEIDAQEAKASLIALQGEATSREEALLQQLEQHRQLLSRVAEEYGQLASTSVPVSIYDNLKHQHAASQLKLLRLQRKLANSEGQVIELAHLIRQTKEINSLLYQQLTGALDEIAFHCNLPPSPQIDDLQHPDCAALIDTIQSSCIDVRSQQLDIHRVTLDLVAEFYLLKCSDLLFACSAFDKELSATEAQLQQHKLDLASTLASHEAIATRLESVQLEKVRIQDELQTTTNSFETFKASATTLSTEIADLQEQLRENALMHDAALKRERDTIQRLTGTVQKSRMAEDALRAEIDQLTTELTDAERYQEAYYSLSDEVGSLLSRNQLAEQEAAKLSKFNAEILGHNNPAQRIMYVDRIRQELAEAKHKIVMLTREQEAIIARSDDLQHEVDTYKSVMVPVGNKPRTNITRVGRPPLVNLTRSLNTSALPTSSSSEKVKQHAPSLDAVHGDMTLDEIL
ncbi:hypothetical protein BDQ12DRAFT_28373 [Crucibulum laeve]|uniref:Hyaluronan-mediated motility receptor C-terminal domain-containing protein n=1 Tax=Crucibulum laeve TaxID=68775 RepID=A0A5C3ML18_9AGAR|nr:hypothetical protein BDQ12DRAFT_28373 [Crucibulum laeve]